MVNAHSFEQFAYKIASCVSIRQFQIWLLTWTFVKAHKLAIYFVLVLTLYEYFSSQRKFIMMFSIIFFMNYRQLLLGSVQRWTHIKKIESQFRDLAVWKRINTLSRVLNDFCFREASISFISFFKGIKIEKKIFCKSCNFFFKPFFSTFCFQILSICTGYG